MAIEFVRRSFTRAEYHRMAKAGILKEDDRVELIDGQIVEMTPIGPVHAGKVNRLAALFFANAGRTAVVAVQNPIALNEISEPQADLMVLKPRTDFYESATPTPPDVLLLVEVADTSIVLDRRVKIGLYARNGVAETWLLDLTRDTLTVYRDPSPEGYRSVQSLRRGERISPLALPTWSLEVAELTG